MRSNGGDIEQTEESHVGGDALAAQAEAFVAAVQARRIRAGQRRSGRGVLDLALQVGRLIRERLQKLA